MVGGPGQEWLGLRRKPHPEAVSSPPAGKEACSSLSTVLLGSTQLQERVAHRGANCGEWEVWTKDGRVKRMGPNQVFATHLAAPKRKPLIFPSGSSCWLRFRALICSSISAYNPSLTAYGPGRLRSHLSVTYIHLLSGLPGTCGHKVSPDTLNIQSMRVPV